MQGALDVDYDGLTPYVTMPADFGSFDIVVDESQHTKICTDSSRAALACADPTHATTGPARALLPAPPGPTGETRYEVYPAGTATTFSGYYHRQGPRLTDGDVFTGVLADGAEVLVAGALAQAALWPGTGERPNPYFNAGLAATKTTEFKYGIQMLSLRDDEQAPTDLWDSYDAASCGCSCTGGGEARETDVSQYAWERPMSDLKTFWDNPGMPGREALDGAGITGRGTDPNVTIDSPNGLTQVLWPAPPVGGIDGQETENSVSGLPSTPNRFEPSEQPPPPPTLQDRRPGTIDER
jgi:hypothetical protein